MVKFYVDRKVITWLNGVLFVWKIWYVWHFCANKFLSVMFSYRWSKCGLYTNNITIFYSCKVHHICILPDWWTMHAQLCNYRAMLSHQALPSNVSPRPTKKGMQFDRLNIIKQQQQCITSRFSSFLASSFLLCWAPRDKCCYETWRVTPSLPLPVTWIPFA